MKKYAMNSENKLMRYCEKDGNEKTSHKDGESGSLPIRCWSVENWFLAGKEELFFDLAGIFLSEDILGIYSVSDKLYLCHGDDPVPVCQALVPIVP